MYMEKRFNNGMRLKIEESSFNLAKQDDGIYIVDDNKQFPCWNTSLYKTYATKEITVEEYRKNKGQLDETVLETIIEDLSDIIEELKRTLEKRRNQEEKDYTEEL